MATKKTQITLRVQNEAIREAIKKASEDQKRSVATLIEVIVEEWLKKHGYL